MNVERHFQSVAQHQPLFDFILVMVGDTLKVSPTIKPNLSTDLTSKKILKIEHIMRTPNNKKSSQQLEILLQQQAEKIAQLERGQAIETAIEHIRARALSMHHSYEVKDVASMMRQALINLGIEGVSAATIWIEQTKDKVRAWDFTNVQEVADSKDLGVDLVLDLEKGRTHPKAYFWNVWNNREETYSVVASNMETLYASMNWLVELDETMGKELLHLLDTRQLTYWWHASAAIKKGIITIDFVAPPPVEMAIILPKMATAFDLAYRRFEDLQKAEAQTREAQIEVALERVRAKTMAMHKTEDLREVVGVLYEQVNLLDLANEGCNINIFKEDINSIETWMAGFDGISLPDCYYMEGQAHPFLQRQWDNWREQAPPFHISTAGKELTEYAKYIVEETDLKRVPDDYKAMMLAIPALHFSFITFKYGQLEIVNTTALPAQEKVQILTRFAKVFEQTYTRFLDIQKAEAQARKAQIETSIERIRARALAMHQSQEIQEVAKVIRGELRKLGIADILSTGIWIEHQKGQIRAWDISTIPETESQDFLMEFTYPITDAKRHPKAHFWNIMYQGKDYFTTQSDKSTLYATFNWLAEFDENSAKELIQLVDAGYLMHWWHAVAAFEKGVIVVDFNEEPPPEMATILPRMAAAFDLAYRRFEDLETAEAQAKEAQIETALERVRAQTMAMHKSEELSKVATAMFTEFHQLGLINEIARTVININNEENGDCEMWLTQIGGAELRNNFQYNYLENELWEAEYRAYQQVAKNKRKEHKYIVTHDGKAFEELVAFGIEKKLITPEDFKIIKEEGIQKWIEHIVWFAYGSLVIARDSPLSEDGFNILQRFAAVFEQTYTRFLDLQKAEAQAKEAQIEAALERVRSASMAMHNSSELQQVVQVMFEQMQTFGISSHATLIEIFDAENGLIDCWFADHLNSYHITHYEIRGKKNHTIRKMWTCWKEQQPSMAIHLKGVKKKKYDTYLLTETGFSQIPDALKKDIRSSKEGYFTYCSMRYGLIQVVDIHPIPAKNIAIIQRFAKVFEQSYTRFLDLQKAEEQAKEAQIEAALERVRAATMAMHHSSELSDAVKVLFAQFQNLKIDTVANWIGFIDVAANTMEIWSTSGEKSRPAYTVNGADYHNFQADIDAFKNKNAYRQHSMERAMAIEVLQEQFELELNLPDETTHYHLLQMRHEFGFLGYGSWQEADAAVFPVLKRFCGVFEQTYTRFLDLQKAEAQVREAQIEAALEKVRAASMAMHHSNELMDVTNMLFEQMHNIGLKAVSSWISLINVETDALEMWLRHEESEIAAQIVSGKDHPNFRADIDAWKNKDASIKFADDKADFIFAMKHLFGFEIYNHPDKTHFHLLEVYHRFGWLGLGTWDESTAEEIEICNRFANVFEQTYTRFLDLQKAEAQAREAQIEAALERVRARAMAMRQSTELSEAAELLYHEFFKLGVKPFSCGYLINDDEKGEWRIWLTNPGEPFFKEYWTIPYTADHNLQARYKSWKNKEDFHCAVLEGVANQAHHQVICQYAPWKEEVTDNLASQLVFNSAHFSLGHLLVISPDRLSSELEQAMVRFANVFDLTYRRFLDLEKAEEQNRQLEKVFNENQRLLHSILPKQIAEQIRTGQQSIVKRFEAVSILFADIVGFTILSEKLSPQKVVDILNGLFSKFDDLTDKYQLEKIKTIGDAYMVAAGVPEEKDNHAQLMFAFAKEMLQTLQAFNQAMGGTLKIRIGISSGPVVAGVIGKKKFAYDLWGDTVNTAARMEANGRADCIQVSPTTYVLLKKETVFEKIPNVEIKGKGKMDVYLWTP